MSQVCEGCQEQFQEGEEVYYMIPENTPFCEICSDAMDRPYLFEKGMVEHG